MHSHDLLSTRDHRAGQLTGDTDDLIRCERNAHRLMIPRWIA
jgi:hypothetical protein